MKTFLAQKMPHHPEHLHYQYEWQTEPATAPAHANTPLKYLLNRKDGYEVLNLIRSLMIENNWRNQATGEKIECMIHCCPLQLQSAEQVKSWIFANWRYF